MLVYRQCSTFLSCVKMRRKLLMFDVVKPEHVFLGDVYYCVQIWSDSV